MLQYLKDRNNLDPESSTWQCRPCRPCRPCSRISGDQSVNQKMGLSGQDVDLLHSAVLNRSSEEMGRTWQDYKCLENHRKFTSLKMEPLHPKIFTQNSEAEFPQRTALSITKSSGHKAVSADEGSPGDSESLAPHSAMFVTATCLIYLDDFGIPV